MADFKAADLLTRPLHMDAHGNAWCETYSLTATGAVNDKFYFGVIPAGVEVHRVRTINQVMQASCTLDLGFEPVNAAVGPAANLTYWHAVADIAAAGADESSAWPIRFDHPVMIVGTIKGATTSGAKRIDVQVMGEAIGVA
jgi:hypothetical protein